MLRFVLLAVLAIAVVNADHRRHLREEAGLLHHSERRKTQYDGMYYTQHGHLMPELPKHDCHSAAEKICLAHRRGATFADHILLSTFARCVVNKRGELPKKCHHFSDSYAPCVADLERLCPLMNHEKTHACMEDKWQEISDKCRTSDWYLHQFPHDHARQTKIRHHHDFDHDHHPDNLESYVTPHDVHEGIPDL